MSSLTVQDHIHLDLVANIGGAPELAPTATYTVKADAREKQYEFYAEFERGWTGAPFFSTMVDSGGSPSLFKNFRYTVRVNPDQLAALEALLLRHVVLVDNEHCPNSNNHTNYIKHMRFENLVYGKTLDPLLQIQEVTITLREEDPAFAL